MKFLLSLALTFAVSFAISARTSSDDDLRQIEILKKKVSAMKEDISNLRNSVSSLEKIQTRLTGELQTSEAKFKTRFEEILFPLLNWPKVAVATRMSSWVEQEHMNLVLEAARKRLTEEPLQLISDRDLKLRQAAAMKSNFSDTLKSLESKQSLLDLQLEELKQLHSRLRRGANHGAKRKPSFRDSTQMRGM